MAIGNFKFFFFVIDFEPKTAIMITTITVFVVLMYLYLYDPVHDLKEYYYRVNNLYRADILTSNLNSGYVILQVLGTTSKPLREEKKNSPKEYLFI